MIRTNALCCTQVFVITSPVRQYAAFAGLVTVIAGCCAAICCIWAFVIAGPMQQYAAYAGPAHSNHKPDVATCGIWALCEHRLYLGLCEHRLCAAICWPCAVRRQALCRNVSKIAFFFWMSRSPSHNQHRHPHSYIQAGVMV